MPVGFELTVPEPVPALVTSRDWFRANVAVIVVGPVIVVVHEPVPEQAVPRPATVHPTNCELAPVDAVSDSELPWGTIAVHVPGHAMPAEAPATVPEPEPPSSTVTGYSAMSKVAVTAVAALTVTVQVVAVPLQAPPQPANWAPASGVAISVTIVSRANAALHVVPQLMPPGFEVTVPAAVPSLVTVRVAVPGGASVGSASTTALSSAGASTIGMKVGSSVAQAARVTTKTRRLMRRSNGDIADPWR
jgi:hypothetical protein